MTLKYICKTINWQVNSPTPVPCTKHWSMQPRQTGGRNIHLLILSSMSSARSSWRASTCRSTSVIRLRALVRSYMGGMLGLTPSTSNTRSGSLTTQPQRLNWSALSNYLLVPVRGLLQNNHGMWSWTSYYHSFSL